MLVKQLDGCSFRKYRVWECLLAIETVFIAPTTVARPPEYQLLERVHLG